MHERAVEPERRIPHTHFIIAPHAWMALATACVVSCSQAGSVLQRNAEARHMTAALQTSFADAVEAGDRAVMADTDEGARAHAEEAAKARAVIEKSTHDLKASLEELGIARNASCWTSSRPSLPLTHWRTSRSTPK